MKKLTRLALAVGLLSTSVAANAALQTQTFVLDVAGNIASSGQTSFDNVHKFAGDIATLNDVVIGISASYGGSVLQSKYEINNQDPNASGTATSHYTLTGSVWSTTPGITPFTPNDAVVSVNIQDTLSGQASATHLLNDTLQQTYSVAANTTNLMSDLALFQGIDDFNLTLYWGLDIGAVDISGSLSDYYLTRSFDNNSAITVTVTYDYTIPEPGIVGLLGLGMLGALVAGRRKSLV